MSQEELVRLPAWGSGAHTIYTDEAGRMIVEWYDFGEEVPYESANMLILGAEVVAALSRGLGLARESSQGQIATVLAERFGSYFAIRDFLDTSGLPYRHEVDFQP
jgi:hypothetical protein